MKCWCCTKMVTTEDLRKDPLDTSKQEAHLIVLRDTKNENDSTKHQSFQFCVSCADHVPTDARQIYDELCDPAYGITSLNSDPLQAEIEIAMHQLTAFQRTDKLFFCGHHTLAIMAYDLENNVQQTNGQS